MAARMLRALLVLQLISVLIPSACHRKKQPRRGPPAYRLHEDDVLPADLQITTFLNKNETKRFYYTSRVGGGALSVTLSVCTSPVRWSFEPDNSTHVTRRWSTYHIEGAIEGVYTLEMTASEGATYVHVYVSTEQGGPEVFRSARNANLRLVRRQKKKRLTVKWSPSPVDPRYTDYCLVVSVREFDGALCSAPGESPKPKVVCVGQRTHHTLADLTQGRRYHYTVFATNKQTNFTYRYATTSAVFDGKFKPARLKDGKAAFADLKKLDGKAVFRYKTPKNVSRPLELFIVPCGGAVDVEVALKDATVVRPRRIEGFRRISVEAPLESTRYYVKIFALNKEELKRLTGVEVYATTKSIGKIPLPSMPQYVKLKEYEGLKTCNSVTVGWMVAPTRRPVLYCVTVKEGTNIEMDDYRIPNQCGIESRLRKSTDFTVKYCMNIKPIKEEVKVSKVRQLKPARRYIVQVTVKKHKGKTLSYDLLHVYTKSCKANATII